MIEICDVSYVVKNKEIISNINCQINYGEITTILGANGAGKSTLLKTLSGALKPTKGKIIIDGKNIDDFSLEELAKKRAVMSQNSNINFPFSVLEIVLMGRNPYKCKDDLEIANLALQKMDCTHLAARVFSTLSGGEQQRVQLARVLAQIWHCQNTILFLDEPTSALDLKHQHQLLELAQNLTSKNITVICIMHDLNLAAKYSDKLLLMKQGKLVKYGFVKDVLTTEIIAEIYDLDSEKAQFALPIL